jgi:hypothetical protein
MDAIHVAASESMPVLDVTRPNVSTVLGTRFSVRQYRGERTLALAQVDADPIEMSMMHFPQRLGFPALPTSRRSFRGSTGEEIAPQGRTVDMFGEETRQCLASITFSGDDN